MKLLKNTQFQAVLARRLRAKNSLLVLNLLENDCGHPRLGISITKKCKSAVTRNRFKRLIREVFRQNQNEIPQNYDYLIMITPYAMDKLVAKKVTPEHPNNACFKQFEASFKILLKKIDEKAEKSK